MVRYAANCERLHLIGARNSANISPQLCLHFCWNRRLPVLRCKYIMNKDAGVCVVGHGVHIVASAVPGGTCHSLLLFPALDRPRGCAAHAICIPGYFQSSLTGLLVELAEAQNSRYR